MDRVFTPQQEQFLYNYTNPKSKTFSNAKQSAIAAGYSEGYADNITSEMPDWLLGFLGRHRLLEKSEKVLERTLEIDPLDEKIGGRAVDVGKFIAGKLGKDVGYSERTELTGKDGAPIEVDIDISEELLNELNEIHKGTNISGDGIKTDSMDSEVQD